MASPGESVARKSGPLMPRPQGMTYQSNFSLSLKSVMVTSVPSPS